MSASLDAVRAALSGAPAWLVGGAVRDRALGRAEESCDVDVVLDGDTRAAAKAIARAAGGAACFALSERFGAWRVVARDHSWQVDVEPLRGGSLQADLALRDFTANAIAEPLAGGEPIDPLGGLGDIRARRLRMAGEQAFEQDPLRVLRLVRVSLELALEPDAGTLAAAGAQARRLREVSSERVFAELRRILASDRARAGIELLVRLAAAAAVLPEIEQLRGVEQSRYHHLDVYGHTLEVLDRAVAMTRPGGIEAPELAPAVGAEAAQLAALLGEPLADELTRGQALRWGALLHDAAKPQTREVRAGDGRVTFIGHDALGAELARAVLGRLRASERLRAHVAALVRHHLRAGFLVHQPQPLARRTVFEYMRATDPVQLDVTLLSLADRLATRGARAQEAIEAHLRVARGLLADGLSWRRHGPGAPLLRGDELAEALGVARGPRLGELLEELACAHYAGEIASREQALEHARAALARAAVP